MRTILYEDCDRMFRRILYFLQDERCACCGCLFPWRDPNVIYIGEPAVPLVLDHDHLDDCIRGMVCPTCNRQIGKVERGKQEPSPTVDAYLVNSRTNLSYLLDFY